ncbi:hypothetical protein N7517_011454 [Penicillium concentricum]|uniref:STAS domain-containing protein n=1 Tax=Penicillium concentricum TaxID=293559 RepID=A0A9W9UVE6_9EURO|nr:uncharacterized protein N7517_011454 [Penicillium concentricum]KAJ5356845.1 hypothetical protein N7517_011454 [Penicillium concentricum]
MNPLWATGFEATHPPLLKFVAIYGVSSLFFIELGITVGAVVIPQGMAYAELAKLPPEYGLYSSFMGVLIYWFFATSKDITIGPVAVMSTLMGSIIRVQAVRPEIPPPVLASALAIICGAIILFLGLLRLGFIVDFIPLPAISAFMSGSAINVCAGQLKTDLGEKAHFSTRGATYKIIIDTLKHLPSAQMEAAMGLTALAMLYGIRSAFHRRHHPAFKLLGYVPRGFKAAGVPKIDVPIIKAFVGELPAAVIVLLIEHIAISKSFGRVNNYTIDPSQEFIAIGIANLLGPFLGGYPATGSFSRTAIKAKCGVRTPLAGVITAVVVLLAIYALPALFFFIPKSSLSAVIIHAVGDLVTPPHITYQFWRVSPIDALIFFMGVIVIIFSTIETGIYCTIGVSLAVLLFRLAKARGQFLGYVQVHSVVGDHILKGDPSTEFEDDTDMSRRVYLPTEHEGGTNPRIKIHQPAPGIFIYRVSEGFNYPNANHYTDLLVSHIFKETRRTNPQAWETPGDRPWNDPGPTRAERKILLAEEAPTSPLPTLRAIILNLAAVNNVDVTSVQNLIDVRNQLDRWASPDSVQWHFAHIQNRWTKRALAAVGFGFPAVSDESGSRLQRSIFHVAEILDGSLPGSEAQSQVGSKEDWSKDVEAGLKVQESGASSSVMGVSEDDIQVVRTGERDAKVNTHRRRGRSGVGTGMAVVDGINQPFFHVDLTSALKSAVADV